MAIKLTPEQQQRGLEVVYPNRGQVTIPVPPTPDAQSTVKRGLLLRNPFREVERAFRKAETDSAQANSRLRYPTDANTVVGPMPVATAPSEPQYNNSLGEAVERYNAKQRALKKSRERKIRAIIGATIAGLIAIGLAYGYLTLTKDGQELVYQKRVDLNSLLHQGENYKYPRHGDMDRSTNETKEPIVFDETEFFSYAKITRGENGTETWKAPKLGDGFEFSNRGNARVELNGEPFMRFGVMKKTNK